MSLLPESGVVIRSLPIPNEFNVVCPRLYYAPSGDLFISSTTHVIYVYRQSNPNNMEVFAGSNGKPGCANGDRVLDATFNIPRGMAADDAGLLVADTDSNLIRLISGNQVITYAGSGKEGSHDGAKEHCSFTRPVCIVKSGTTIFVSEPAKIRMIHEFGWVTSICTFRTYEDLPMAIFYNHSALMISPDSRKLYEIDYDAEMDGFVLGVASLDSMAPVKKVTLGYSYINSLDTEWPTLISTTQGYIIADNMSSQLYSWDSDAEIRPIALFRDKCVYQMTISQESGTLAYVTIPSNTYASFEKLIKFSPDYISFAHSFAKSWQSTLPFSSINFSNIFDCSEGGPDVEFVLGEVSLDNSQQREVVVSDDQKEEQQAGLTLAMVRNQSTAGIITIKLHSKILAPYFPENCVLQSLETLNELEFCSVEFKIDFLKSLYQPEIFKEGCYTNLKRDASDFHILSRLCSIIVLYHIFSIDYRSIRCILWRLLAAHIHITSDHVIEITENNERNQNLLVNLFCYAWRHAKHNAVFDIILSFMTPYPDIVHDRWSTFYSLMSPDSKETVECLQFFFQATGKKTSVDEKGRPNINDRPPSSILLGDAVDLEGRITNPSGALFIYLQNLFRNECLQANSSAELSSIPRHTFRIGIIGCERFVHAREFILYSRWKFFRRIMDAGCGEEISSRHILLPVDFPYELLECIIQILFYQHPQPLKLSYDTCFFFVEQGAQFNLTDFERKAEEPFESLHLYCSLQVYEPITIQNSLKMASIYSQFGMQEELDDAIAVARVNVNAAIAASPHELRNLSSDIIDKLTRDFNPSVLQPHND